MGPCFRRDDKWGYHLHFSNSLPCSATTSRSRRVFCASFAGTSRPLRTEGAGNAERPIAACAMVVVERTRVSQVTPESPGTPRAMVYGLYRALPGEPGFLATVAGGIASTDLTPASGCQDHTTSPSASVPFVNGTSASTASHPASVTIAIRPSSGTRRGEF